MAIREKRKSVFSSAARRSWHAAIAMLLAALLSSPATALTERPILNGELHGTLTMPDLPPQACVMPMAAVLIIAGSGPVDRDGNLPNARNDSLKLLAHGLADKGIVSLRFDKRGVGENRAAGPREEDLRFRTYVSDALSWLARLRANRLVGRVLLLGHSEGALVATLAAQHTHVAGLILLAGAGEPASRIIARQLAAAGVSEALQTTSRQIADRLAAGEAVTDVPPELMALYRPSVQNYMMSWLPLDPAAELAKTTSRVLVVQGGTDLQTGPQDAERLIKARKAALPQQEALMVLIEDMNHVLRSAPAERAQNLKTYNEPQLPLANALIPALLSFIDPL